MSPYRGPRSYMGRLGGVSTPTFSAAHRYPLDERRLKHCERGGEEGGEVEAE